MKSVIVTGGGAVSGSRASYISKSKTTVDEGSVRPLFNDNENSLTRDGANSYLAYGSVPQDGELAELIVSIERKDFAHLGGSVEEQTEAFREVVRDGLNALWKRLGVSDVRYAAGIHLNTNNPHAHILLRREAVDAISGETRFVDQIPRSWFWQSKDRKGENSELGKLFEQPLKQRSVAVEPESILSLSGTDEVFLPAKEFNTERIDRSLTRLSELNQISTRFVEQLASNSSLYVSRQGALVFLRRTTNGSATGHMSENGSGEIESRGFFFVGNPNTATSFVIADNPKEVLAAIELTGHRDLSDVCFVAADNDRCPEALTEFLKVRTLETAVRVIWATSLDRNNKQETGHFEELQEALTIYRPDGAPRLDFISWIPRSSYGRTWHNQLMFRNLPGELNSIYRQVLTVEEALIADDSLLHGLTTEEYNARIAEVFSKTTVDQDEGAFVVKEKTADGSGVEYGRYRWVIDTEEGPTFEILSVNNEATARTTFANEVDAIAHIESAYAEAREIAAGAQASQQSVDQDPAPDAVKNEDTMAPANTVVRPTSTPRMTASEVTTKLKEIPLENVMPIFGLALVYDRERREFVYRDEAKNFKIKVTRDMYCDRFDDNRGGSNAINLTMHLGGMNFKEARQLLLDRFGYDYQPVEPARPRLEGQDEVKIKPPFVMPERNDDRLQGVINYLTEARAIDTTIVLKAIERGDIFANTFGSAVFVNRDQDGRILGASWRSVSGTKRGEAPGSEKNNAWFYLGDLHTAKDFVIVESPIEAMSFYQLYQDKIDLGATAIISAATNAVPGSLINFIENRPGEKGNIIVAFNNDDGGDRGYHNLLEKTGAIVLLKHRSHHENGLLENIPFTGSISRILPTLEDWNEDLKTARDADRDEAAAEHVVEAVNDTTRPESLTETTSDEYALDSITVTYLEGQDDYQDDFTSVIEFNNFLRSIERPQDGHIELEFEISLTNGTALEDKLELSGKNTDYTLSEFLYLEATAAGHRKFSPGWKDKADELDGQIRTYTYFARALDSLEANELQYISKSETFQFSDEVIETVFEKELIRSVTIGLPTTYNKFGKAEILLARESDADPHFHIGYRITIGDRVIEQLPDRATDTFSQGKTSLLAGADLLRASLEDHWRTEHEAKTFPESELKKEPGEADFVAVALHHVQVYQRTNQGFNFTPAFPVDPQFSRDELATLDAWAKKTRSDRFYRIDEIFAGEDRTEKHHGMRMYHMANEGYFDIQHDGQVLSIGGGDPLLDEVKPFLPKPEIEVQTEDSDEEHVLGRDPAADYDVVKKFQLADPRSGEMLNLRRALTEAYEPHLDIFEQNVTFRHGARTYYFGERIKGDLRTYARTDGGNVRTGFYSLAELITEGIITKDLFVKIIDASKRKTAIDEELQVRDLHLEYFTSYIPSTNEETETSIIINSRYSQQNYAIGFLTTGDISLQETVRTESEATAAAPAIFPNIQEALDQLLAIEKTKADVEAHRADSLPGTSGLEVNIPLAHRLFINDRLPVTEKEWAGFPADYKDFSEEHNAPTVLYNDKGVTTFAPIVIVPAAEIQSLEEHLAGVAELAEQHKAAIWLLTYNEFVDAVWKDQIDFALPGKDGRTVSSLVQTVRDTRANQSDDPQNIEIAEESLDRALKNQHHAAVTEAYGRRLFIPDEVLAEYPALLKNKEEKEALKQPETPPQVITILPAKDQKGRAEKRIAKILHAHNIADKIAAGDDSYFRLDNEPWMAMHITREYSENKIHFTHWYIQNGDMMHDGEMVFNYTKDGRLSLHSVGTTFMGRTRYSYDRSFADMFSKNLIDQGFEKATLVRPHDEDYSTSTEAADFIPDGSGPQIESGRGFFDAKEITRAENQTEKSRELLIDLPIADFLTLANGLDERVPEKDSRIKDALDNQIPLAQLPMLKIGRVDDRIAEVMDHDGRHRALALQEAGVKTIPVILHAENIRWIEANISEFPHTLRSQDGSNLVTIGTLILGALDRRPTPVGEQPVEIETIREINPDTAQRYLEYLVNGGHLPPQDLILLREALKVRLNTETEALHEGMSAPPPADLWEKVNLQKDRLFSQFLAAMDIVNSAPNSFGHSGDLEAEETYHFTDPEGLLGILEENTIYGDGGETVGVSTTTNRIFDHPDQTTVQWFGELNKPSTFAEKGIRIDLDLIKLREAGLLIRAGNDDLGTFIGEEEIRIGRGNGIENAADFIKQIVVDRKIVGDQMFEDIKARTARLLIPVIEKTDYSGHVCTEIPAYQAQAGETASAIQSPGTPYKAVSLALDIEPPHVKPGTIALANEIREKLHAGEKLGNNVAFNAMVERHFNLTRTSGHFNAKDAYDALELGVNLYLLDHADRLLKQKPEETLAELRRLLPLLPTQNERTDEMMKFQQFSTVPTESYVAFLAAGIKPGDILLEPSAGCGSLALWAKASGAITHVNEISERRAGILKIIGFEGVTRKDAQFLHDTLPAEIKPSVVLMNPPFSSTGGRTEKNRTKYGAEHVSDALKRLQPGGRLVAIVGEGMGFEKSSFTSWWQGILNTYNVRANVGIDGDEYAKYGTNYGNQILVIDKTGATPGATMGEQLTNVLQGSNQKLEDVLPHFVALHAERAPAAPPTVEINEQTVSIPVPPDQIRTEDLFNIPETGPTFDQRNIIANINEARAAAASGEWTLLKGSDKGVGRDKKWMTSFDYGTMPGTAHGYYQRPHHPDRILFRADGYGFDMLVAPISLQPMRQVDQGRPEIETETVTTKATVDNVPASTESLAKYRIEKQAFINRQDLRDNPDKIYLFGDNLEEKGLGGQAKEMRGEPNAIGIPTKRRPSNDEGAFFSDTDFDQNTKAIDLALAKLAQFPAGVTIVIPESGLGTGLARLEEKAPRTFEYLQERLNALDIENVPAKAAEDTWPPVDLIAYEKAMQEAPEYDPDDPDQYTPEEVRDQFVQEALVHSASTIALAMQLRDGPQNAKERSQWSRLETDFEIAKGNVISYVEQTGLYFGQENETELRSRMASLFGITIDDSYNVILPELPGQARLFEEEAQPTLFGEAEPITAAAQPIRSAPIVRPDLREDSPDQVKALTTELMSNLGLDEVLRNGGQFDEKIVLPESPGERLSISRVGRGRIFLSLYDTTGTDPVLIASVAHNVAVDGALSFREYRAIEGRDEVTEASFDHAAEKTLAFTKRIRAAHYLEYALDHSNSSAAEVAEALGVGDNTEARENVGTGTVRYKPAKLRKGAAHPGDIVESSSMAAVMPPDITYIPKLPARIIKNAALSALQFEAVCYAGQRHETILPDGSRTAFFIGDGTGVGKGRELAAIALDNWNQGRRRILWLSINYDLVPSTKRDLDDLGARVPLATLDKLNIHSNLEESVGDAVLFGSYATLIGKGKDGSTRLEQITKWLGPDGVIFTDEGHLAKNAVADGMSPASQRGEAILDIQSGPLSRKNWRFVYSSATGATELRNMAYMERLGLWGFGTGFPGGFTEFHNTIDRGGVGALEMVARDMKAQGMYLSRSLSFEGVDYTQVTHDLTPEQFEIYNLSSRAWSEVVRSFDESLRSTMANGKARAMAYSRLWSSQQLFYRQLLTALKVPSIIRETERVLEEGSLFTDPKSGESFRVPAQVVIGVIGTGEARTKDQISRAMQHGLDLDSLDFSPKQILLNVVEKAYPTQRFTVSVNSAGKEVFVPIVDEDGRPVESSEAIARRDELLAELNEKVVLPDNPLDQIVNYFGENATAEITGRDRRIIIDPETFERRYVKRAREGVAMDKASQDEMISFQASRKRVAIISQSASTGISLHSEIKPILAEAVRDHKITAADSKEVLKFWQDTQDTAATYKMLTAMGVTVYRRVHATLETSWSADIQMQTFGRTHRSGELFPPEYLLVSTNLGGERRFLSTIAKRLSSLGALTKGDRDQAGGGNLLQYDFENKYGEEAAKKIVTMLRDGRPGILDVLPPDPQTNEPRSGIDLLYTMGLAKTDGTTFKVNEKTLKELKVSTFLNRVLILDVDTQNAVFDAFTREMEAIIHNDKELGLFDEGIQDIEGSNIRLAEDPKVVSVDKGTGAETMYFQVHADLPTEPVTLEEIAERNKTVRFLSLDTKPVTKQGQFYYQKTSRNIIYVEHTGTRSNASSGMLVNHYKFARPSGWQSNLLTEYDLKEKYALVFLENKRVFKDDIEMTVEEWWNNELANTPKIKTSKIHLIGGAVLPVWQRLTTSNEKGNQLSLKTVRVETEDGKRIVGVQIPVSQINRVLRDLDVKQSFKTADEIYEAVLDTREIVNLVGGIKLRPTLIKKQAVVEIVNLSQFQKSEFQKYGALKQMIGFDAKYYLSSDPDVGIPALERILEQYPAVDATEAEKAVPRPREDADTDKGFGALPDGALARFGSADEFYADAGEIRGKDISRYWWKISAEINTRGNVAISPAAYELIRSTYYRAYDEDLPEFDGLFNEPQNVDRYVDALLALRAERTSFDETLTGVLDTIETARAGRNGTMILLAVPEAEDHEELHAASFVASNGATLEERHARFDELVASQEYQIAKENLSGIYRTRNDGILVEEAFAYAWEGKGAEIGLDPDQSANYAYNWFKSFSEKNGDITEIEFKELMHESENIRNAAYERIEAAFRQHDGRTESNYDRETGRTIETLSERRSARNGQAEELRQYFREDFDQVALSSEEEIRLQLGKELLADLHLSEIQTRLAAAEVTAATTELTVFIKDGAGDRVPVTTSLKRLEQERAAFAARELENDRKAGFVKMTASDDFITEEEANEIHFQKGLDKAQAEQQHIIDAITTATDKRLENLRESLDIAEKAAIRTQTETQDLLAREDADRRNYTAMLRPDTIWREQENAARRGDLQAFNRLQLLHEDLGLPRPNDAFSRLLGLELITDLNARKAEKEAENLFAKTRAGNSDDRVVLKLTRDEEDRDKANVANWRLENVNVHQENLEKEADKHLELAGKERFRAIKSLFQPTLNKINPLSHANGTLLWFTNPKSALNRHLNPIQVIKYDPAVQIVRAVYGFFKHRSKAAELEDLAKAATDKAQLIKDEFGSAGIEKKRSLAESVSEAVKDEEILRAELRIDPHANTVALETPERALTNSELKTIGDSAATLGDAELLRKYQGMLEDHPELKEALGETADRIAADSLIAEARAAAAAADALKDASILADGDLEVVLDPLKLQDAFNQIDVADVAADYHKANSIKDGRPIKLDISDSDELLTHLEPINDPQGQLSTYLKDQIVDEGARVSAELETPLSNLEEKALNELTLDNQTVNRLEQIRLSGTQVDAAQEMAEIATKNGVEIPTVAENLDVINTAGETERAETEFWKKDRMERESIDSEEYEVQARRTEEQTSRVIEAEEEEAIVAEAAEAVEGAEIIAAL